MTNEQETILLIKGIISDLPAKHSEAVNELAEHFRVAIKAAGGGGYLALALVSAEAQLKT